MTPSQKTLIKKLLTGHFLRKMDRGKGVVYVLYDSRTNPVEKIKPKTVERIGRFLDPKLKLWKKHGGRISLNLSTVRQLHGKNMIKQLYKQKDSIATNNSIHKTRTRRKKIKNDEKNNYLF